MDTRELIANKLQQDFNPEFLEVIDESHKHAGHKGAIAGKQTHFLLQIKSAAFTGKTLVQAHRMIYASLADFMNNPVHALEIKIFNH